ncbi:biotin transporter BioY [Sinorhizobium sp. BG8]|uniref:biotin transporter BioY n=1 Tax=Sinorhizobium sp. BG8 TaxID=2613773 RepID=UPI00193CD184|nr:biotin transporter BioY [Sinorhizobium sp. BG8]QRM54088.1 biotin transporter BioY [Sinorhizobium sp. BG8]
MSGLENAIRSALARSERSNPEIRARIYQSARNALEAGLRKQEISDPETVAAQRHRLESTIHQIETEEREALRTRVSPATRGDTPAARNGTSDGDLSAVAGGDGRLGAAAQRPAGRDADSVQDIGGIRPSRDEGLLRAEGPVSGAKPSAAEGQPSGNADFRPERAAKGRRRRSRVFSFLLVVSTLVAAIGAAAWWIESSGLLLSPQERDSSVANPPATVSGEDFTGEDPLKRALDTQSRFSDAWRTVFMPGQNELLSAEPQGRFEVITTNEGPATRVTSSDPEREGAVRIEVAPDVLAEMAGKSSTIALAVEAGNGKPAQISIECEFPGLGECGRHRYTVSERTDVLFQVTFKGSASPSGAGHLYLNSDLTGTGTSLNLYAVRILPGE